MSDSRDEKIALSFEDRPEIPSYKVLDKWLDNRSFGDDVYWSPLRHWTLEFTASSRHGGGTVRENWKWQPVAATEPWVTIKIIEVLAENNRGVLDGALYGSNIPESIAETYEGILDERNR